MDVGSMPINASSTAASRSGDVSNWLGAKSRSSNIVFGDSGPFAGVPWYVWAGAGYLALMWLKKKG